eukprot:1160684-Pelagomonas_calceolata.AAC.5
MSGLLTMPAYFTFLAGSSRAQGLPIWQHHQGRANSRPGRYTFNFGSRVQWLCSTGGFCGAKTSMSSYPEFRSTSLGYTCVGQTPSWRLISTSVKMHRIAFHCFPCLVQLGIARLESTLPGLLELAQGGTAVGTGLNTFEGGAIRERMTSHFLLFDNMSSERKNTQAEETLRGGQLPYIAKHALSLLGFFLKSFHAKHDHPWNI